MEEISINEYVRYKDGTISKVLGIDKNSSFDLICEKFTLSSKFVVNHSKNIIDLIEVGDYVNGYRVNDIETEYYNLVYDEVMPKEKELVIGNEEGLLRIGKEEIRSIVTKEQYKSVEYVF